MADKGRQTPTTSVTLPYEQTKGLDAIELYNSTGRTAQEWQELLLCDILAYNDDGLWTHTKFGYSVPRRNGKSEILAMRELYGLVNGETIMHTAHRTSTSSNAWNLLVSLLEKAGYQEKKDFKTLKRFGLETIKMTQGNGEIHFRTRSSKGGLGEGVDLLVVDEAQEYTDDQESALKYIVTSSMNPQTLFCGTPPTPVSSGTVFTKLRRRALEGNAQNTGWAEWAVEFQSDPNDKSLWYETNPSLGTIFTERSVQDEVGDDDVDFNIQRLGLWIKYNLKSAIARWEWEALQVEPSIEIGTDIYVGVKFGHDGENVSLGIAAKSSDSRTFVEALDCRPIRAGNGWIIEYLTALKARAVVIDGANGQKLLADELKANKVKNIIMPTVKDVIVANNSFEQAIYSKSLCHTGQPSLTQSVTNCEKRAIGNNGGFGYRSIRQGVDVALLESVALANWACSTDKGKKKQKISY